MIRRHLSGDPDRLDRGQLFTQARPLPCEVVFALKSLQDTRACHPKALEAQGHPRRHSAPSGQNIVHHLAGNPNASCGLGDRQVKPLRDRFRDHLAG